MIKAVVLDMGGVIIKLDWLPRINRILDADYSFTELHHLWVSARCFSEFESGKLDWERFGTAFRDEFNLDCSPQSLQDEFLAMVQDPFPNAETVLSDIKARGYTLALLSNTNPAHMGKLKKHSYFDHFDRLFLSYEMGLIKPNPAIYQRLITELDLPPNQIAFFDDGQRNIDVASEHGIQALRVDGIDEVAQHIATFN